MADKKINTGSERLDGFLGKQVDRAGNSVGDSESDYFAPVRNSKLILTQEEIDRGVQKVADVINRDFKGKKIVLCAILKGAFIFTTDLCRKLTRPYSIYFVEAQSYSGQQQSNSVELLSRIVPKKFEGRHIILIDELLDNGHTMHTMKTHLMKELSVESTSITTTVLFSKTVPSRPTEYDAQLVGIPNLPTVWLVGYGLDDQGTKRGWTDVIAVPKIEGIPKTDDDDIFDDVKGPEKLKSIRASILLDLEKPLAPL